MTKDEGMTKQAHSSFVIRHSSFRAAGASAFTVVELLIVMAIILILAGLILATSSYVQKKGYRSRAEAEIAAMSAALENYKADNGIYPRDVNTDTLAAVRDQAYSTKTPPDPNPTSYDTDPRHAGAGVDAYKAASFSLYGQLSGNLNGDRATVTGKNYFQFKSNMLYPAGGTGTVTAVIDPFGNVYGYSTAKAKYNDAPTTNPDYGFNPTFDFWSTAGTGADSSMTDAAKAADAAYEAKWTKNW
jgi:type II secretory pathway pseudopilin PulG